jgi:hypothetical protein
MLSFKSKSWSTDERWTKWLIPTVNVLYAFSTILGAGVGLVCLTACACMGSQLLSPASVIFAGVGVLLSVRILDDFVWAIGNIYVSQAAKDVRGSQDTLLGIFECIEMFFRRLEIYTEVRPTTEMMDTITEMMVEVISVLGIATKEIRQSWISKHLLYKCVTVDRTMFSKIREEADRKDRYGRRAEETGQTDSSGGLGGHRTKSEGYARCWRERKESCG